MRRGSGLLLRHFARGRAQRLLVANHGRQTGRWFRAAVNASTPGVSIVQDSADVDWNWWGVAAAAAAFSAASPFLVHCEANNQDVWDKMTDAVTKTWLAIDEDLHREEAESFFEVVKAEAPKISLSAGQLSITFPLRAGIELGTVYNAVMGQLNSLPGSVSVQSSNLAGAKAVSIKSSGSAGKLTIQMCSPGKADHRPAVEFLKRGALTDDELSVLSAALRAANQIHAHKSAYNPQATQRIDEAGDAFFEAMMKDMVQIQRAFEGFGTIFGRIQDAEQDSSQRPGGLHNSPDEEFHVSQHSQNLPRPEPRPKTAEELEQYLESQRRLRQRLSQRGQPPAEEEERFEYGSRQADAAAKKLQSLGTLVYPPGNKQAIDWGILAGYIDQKQQIEDTLLLALLHPEVYENIAKGTRRHPSNNKPRAVLFEGPPGTGKTTSARVIASQASVPLVYVPLEAVASKWYGESERKLSDVFKAAEQLPGCIIFLDEVDSLATSRNSEMHEATRRLLGVLLRHLDGFETNKRSVVIAATNRKEDLDPALLSRFNTSVQFGLPDEACRAQILHQYAKHLSEEGVASVAEASPGMAGRDLKDISEQAERRWASKIIRKLVPEDQLPPVEEYITAAQQRVQEREAKQQRIRLAYSLL